MNRETKIGLAVILALLTVLGVVLFQRLNRSPDTLTASTTDEEKVAPKDLGDSAETETRSHKQWTAGKPTLLTPSGPSLGADKRPHDEFNRWRMPTDLARKASGRDATAAGQYQPNAMPDPRTPAPDDRYTSSSDARQTASAVAATTTAAGGVDGNAASSVPAQANQADPLAVAVSSVATDPPPSTTAPSTASTATASASQGADRQIAPDSGSASTPVTVAAPQATDASLASAPNAAGSAYSSVSTTPTYRSTGLAVAGSTALPTATDTPRREDGTYEVQPNDNYWTISEKLYGTGAYFRALAEHNRSKTARVDRLQPGLAIAAPPVTQLEQSYPDLCPKPNRREAIRSRAAAVTTASFRGDGRTYVVQEGDTLFTIARNELGKASRWAEIYALNRETLGKDFDYVTPGMSLTMPSKDARTIDRTARHSDSLHQR